MTATQRDRRPRPTSPGKTAAPPKIGPVWLAGYLQRRFKSLFRRKTKRTKEDRHIEVDASAISSLELRVDTLQAKKTEQDRLIERNAAAIRSLKLRVDLMHRALIDMTIKGRLIASDDPLAPLSPLEYLACPGATTTVYAFSGLAAKNSDTAREFHRSLARQKVNVIFVKDFQQCWYQRGLLGVSLTVEETARHLMSLMPDGQTRIVTLGASAGGYAAILYGVLMKADRIAAFSPQTQLTAEVIKHFTGMPATQIQNLLEEAGHADLRSLLATADFPGKIDIHYGLSHPWDSKDAAHLGDLGCVRLIGHESRDHMIANYLKRAGQIDDLLAELCGD